MIYAVCGPMSPHFRLANHLLLMLLQQFYGPVLSVHANKSDDMRHALAERDGAPCLISFDCPDEIICQLVQRTGLPTILVCEPFASLCSFAMHDKGLDFEGAYRDVTYSLSSIHGIAGLSNVTVMKLSDDESLALLASRLATILALPVSGDHIKAALSVYYQEEDRPLTVAAAGNQVWPKTCDARQTVTEFSPEEKRIISKFSKTYDLLPFSNKIERLTWPTETLINAEYGSRLTGPLDLMGPGRLLTYGPYLHVPKGIWKATITFVTTGNLSGNTVVIDIYAPPIDKVLTIARGELPVSGTFSTSVVFKVESPLHALELRMLLHVGSIEGLLEIADVSLFRLSAGESEIASNFNSMPYTNRH